jgi:diacylglycerol kinase family enzyme
MMFIAARTNAQQLWEMAQTKKRVTLIYNENAGNGGESRPDIVELMSHVGFSVTCFSNKNNDIEKALEAPADIVAVAGGDGTVAKVAARARPNGCPIAVLPLGTANNIAKSLGVGRPTVELVASWHIAKHVAFYPIAMAGPWGRCRLIEGIGFGAIEQAIAELPRKTGFARARAKYAEAALSAPAEDLEFRIDSKVLSGSFTVFEVTKFPYIGPNLCLAPGIDSVHRSFAVCSFGDGARERQALAKWFLEPYAGAAPVSVHTASRLEIAGRFRQVRIEGHLWRNKRDGKNGDAMLQVMLETEPEPLFFLVPQ